jgi:hypothetical protein
MKTPQYQGDRLEHQIDGYFLKSMNWISTSCGLLPIRLVTGIGSLILLSQDCNAAFGFKMDGTLDKEAISHAYFEGEFHRVLPPLETYRQSFPVTATREDSIFVFKYLSVIYAADSSTRAKAESYMVQLLKLMPTIELIDLYISDNIQAIFKNVKNEFLQQQEYVRGHDQYGRASKDSTQVKPAGKSASRKWIWWSVAGIGAATSAGVTYYLVTSRNEAGDEYDIKP